MNRVGGLFAVAGLVLALVGCVGETFDDRSADYASRPFAVDDRRTDPWIAASYAGVSPAPSFPRDAQWLNVETPPTLESLRGKIVLVDFWTYGCINCIHNLPAIAELAQRYADVLVVIGVHSAKFPNEGDTGSLQATLRRLSIDYPVVNDHDRAMMEEWGARAWPTLFLIDPAGNIAGKETGEGFEHKFERAIASLIREFDERGELDRSPLPSFAETAASRGAGNRTILSFPEAVLIRDDVLYVADTGHHRILEISRVTGRIKRVFGSGSRGFGNGSASEASFDSPRGMAISDSGRTLYVADTGNHAVRAVDLQSGSVRRIAGTGNRGYHYPPPPGPLPAVTLRSPWDLVIEKQRLYVAMAGSHQLWWIDLHAGDAGYLAGSGAEGAHNGRAFAARLAQPSGVALGGDGTLYFADTESSSIRRYRAAGSIPQEGGKVETVAGPTGSLFAYGLVDGSEARFQHPKDIDVAEGTVYVADTYNHAIRALDVETGIVELIAGGESGWVDGPTPQFNRPSSIDVSRGVAYIADTNNHAIRRLDLDTRVASTLILSTTLPDSVAVPRDVYRRAMVTLPDGQNSVSVMVSLPPGYKLQPASPSRISVTVDNGPSAVFELEHDTIQIPVTLSPNSGEVVVDLWVAYCESEHQQRCYFDQVRYELPVDVVSDRVSSRADMKGQAGGRARGLQVIHRVRRN